MHPIAPLAWRQKYPPYRDKQLRPRAMNFKLKSTLSSSRWRIMTSVDKDEWSFIFTTFTPHTWDNTPRNLHIGTRSEIKATKFVCSCTANLGNRTEASIPSTLDRKTRYGDAVSTQLSMLISQLRPRHLTRKDEVFCLKRRCRIEAQDSEKRMWKWNLSSAPLLKLLACSFEDVDVTDFELGNMSYISLEDITSSILHSGKHKYRVVYHNAMWMQERLTPQKGKCLSLIPGASNERCHNINSSPTAHPFP